MAITREAIGTDAKRESRHVELLHSIGNLNHSRRLLESLFQRIAGPTPETGAKNSNSSPEIERTPNLAETLVRAPSEINKHAEHIEILVHQIEEVLF